jgi:hypothetical protein
MFLPQLNFCYASVGEFDVDHIRVQVFEVRRKSGKAAMRRGRTAAEVAEAQVETDGQALKISTISSIPPGTVQ